MHLAIAMAMPVATPSVAILMAGRAMSRLVAGDAEN